MSVPSEQITIDPVPQKKRGARGWAKKVADTQITPEKDPKKRRLRSLYDKPSFALRVPLNLKTDDRSPALRPKQ